MRLATQPWYYNNNSDSYEKDEASHQRSAH